MTKADLLAAALDQFLDVSPEAEAAAVVSADGLPMASVLPPHVEEDRLAAMSAALLMLGERAASGLSKGELDQVFVEGVHGHVVLMAAGPGAVLVAVTTADAKVGLILFEMRRAAAQVAEILGGPSAAMPEPTEGDEPLSVAVEETPSEDAVVEPTPVATEALSEPTDLEELSSWPAIGSDEPFSEEREQSPWDPRPRSDTEPEVSSW